MTPWLPSPRFAWANAVGGERGELVAIQCALARRPLRIDLAIERRRREAELLEQHGASWAGLGALAHGWRFRRGFVDFAPFATTGVERVEILRESNSVLFGTDALNGGMSRGEVLMFFSESAEHVALTRSTWLGGPRC